MSGPQQKLISRTPPIKGSFPLDHEAVCKAEMLEYMMCLHDHQSENTKCRPEAKAYFKCRMDRGLMDKDEWSKLGYGDNVQDDSSKATTNTVNKDTH